MGFKYQSPSDRSRFCTKWIINKGFVCFPFVYKPPFCMYLFPFIGKVDIFSNGRLLFIFFIFDVCSNQTKNPLKTYNRKFMHCRSFCVCVCFFVKLNFVLSDKIPSMAAINGTFHTKIAINLHDCYEYEKEFDISSSIFRFSSFCDIKIYKLK